MGRAATEIDVVIGARIRAVRLERGFSQGDVANGIGITFQQLQKYETGKNRIAAATLAALAETLNVHLSDLVPLQSQAGESVSLELLESNELRALVDAFIRIRAPALRGAVIAACEAIVKSERR
jgi:transcriptional regulator with XRE-family HTH domain